MNFDTLFSNPSPRQLRLAAGLVMMLGLVAWALVSLWTGNLALAQLWTLAPSAAIFAILMTQSRKAELHQAADRKTHASDL